jgi:arylsulfatase A-like enzyme
MAAGMDQPVAALLADLKRRGMLDDTLVVWCTEFGRGPATQGVNSPGRDHHPDAFTCFLAGAGVKAGVRYGATDEVGYFVAENPVTIYDFHATILHLLGLDHTRLTFYHNGIQRRLTDVHGHVVSGLLA